MQLRNLAGNSPRRSRLLSGTKTPKTIPEEIRAQDKPEPANVKESNTIPVEGTGQNASPNTFFVNNFWESDGPKILFDRLNASAELQTAYRTFLKERAATEKDYAKQLRKSIESTVLMKSIDKEGGTLGSAITQQLSALESLAAAHEALSNALSTNLEPRLKEHLQSCDERRKKQQSAAEASWKTKQTGQTVLQSATEKYRKEANSISSYSAQLTIVAPRELSRIQANLDKCQRGLSRTVEEYKAALKNYKHACSNFEYDYKMFCDLAQDIEEDKIQILSDIGAEVAEIERRTWLNAAKIHEASAFNQIDVSACISEFVESKGTGGRIYNPPEPIDHQSATSDSDTNLSFKVASFPRSSFRYPTSAVNKRSSRASLTSTPPQEASPQSSPARPRIASRLVPTDRASALRMENSASSTVSSRTSKQSQPSSSSASEVSEASEALQNLRLGRGSENTPDTARRTSKSNMIAIGGKMYPVNSPTPSPQTPERVLKPRHSNSGDGQDGLPIPPYSQQRKESSPSPLRRRTVVSTSSQADIPHDMPTEKMADDTFTEIEAWLANNRSTSPSPAPSPKKSLPSSASEPSMRSGTLSAHRSRHAQGKIPLPTSPATSRPASANRVGAKAADEQPHRRSVPPKEDVFLASPSTVAQSRAPERSRSPVGGHVRSQSDRSLSSNASSISYAPSPSPTPFEDTPRTSSPLPTSYSMDTITKKQFNRPRQPTPPEGPPPMQAPQQTPVSPYPWSPQQAGVPHPSPSPWPQGYQAQMRQPSWSQSSSSFTDSGVYSPYHPPTSPAPFVAPTPAPAPMSVYHQHAPPPPTPIPQVVCYVRAEHQYSPTQDDELPLLPGEEIAIFKTDPSGWWYGQSRTSHRTGLVPSNHVRLI